MDLPISRTCRKQTLLGSEDGVGPHDSQKSTHIGADGTTTALNARAARNGSVATEFRSRGGRCQPRAKW